MISERNYSLSIKTPDALLMNLTKRYIYRARSKNICGLGSKTEIYAEHFCYETVGVVMFLIMFMSLGK